MGFFSNLLRLNPERVLRAIVLLEMLYWAISGTLSAFDYYQYLNEEGVLHSIEASLGTRAKWSEAKREYDKQKEAARNVMYWSVLTAAALLLIQLFLYFGVSKKNRCLILCWVLFYLAMGICRIYLVSTNNVPVHIRYAIWIWIVRIFYIYLALKYLLQITNEKLGQEQVAPPEIRPQTDDPREYREGLNYPVFPRSLEFADRVMGINKEEHAHPKRWQPSYDAFDSDGRMVVVVDDPVYDRL